MSKYLSLFSRSGLSLDRLRTLVAIADAGGLSKAARGDPAQMSQFSRQIKDLETYFGVKLTERRGRQLLLNEQGQRLVRVARETLDGLELYSDECRDMPQTISIGAGNSLVEWWLLPRLAELRRAAPRAHPVVESVRTADGIRRLSDMTLDLALVRADAVTRELESLPMLEVRYDLFIPSPFAAGLDRRNVLRKLHTIPLAVSMGGQFVEQLNAAADKAGMKLNTVVACNSFTQAARVVQLGDAAAFLPEIAAVDFKSEPVVQLRSTLLENYVRPLCLAWHPRRRAALSSLDKIIRALQGNSNQSTVRSTRNAR